MIAHTCRANTCLRASDVSVPYGALEAGDYSAPGSGAEPSRKLPLH